MVRAKSAFAWNHTSHVLSMLEGCRQNDVAFDPQKFMPAEYREKKPEPAVVKDVEQHKRDIAEFRAFLDAGAGVRL